MSPSLNCSTSSSLLPLRPGTWSAVTTETVSASSTVSCSGRISTSSLGSKSVTTITSCGEAGVPPDEQRLDEVDEAHDEVVPAAPSAPARIPPAMPSAAPLMASWMMTFATLPAMSLDILAK